MCMPVQCPKCLKAGLLNKTRKPIETRPQSMLEARELPKCDLSNRLEEHLHRAVQGAHNTAPPLPTRHPTHTLLQAGRHHCFAP
jgi:hypothetical protein